MSKPEKTLMDIYLDNDYEYISERVYDLLEDKKEISVCWHDQDQSLWNIVCWELSNDLEKKIDEKYINLIGKINGLPLVNRFTQKEVNILLGEFQNELNSILKNKRGED